MHENNIKYFEQFKGRKLKSVSYIIYILQHNIK